MTAIQQGSLDAAVAGVQLLSGLHFFDAAKYITLTNHAAIFYVVEISKKWYESLPPDLQQIIDRDAASTALNYNPRAQEIEDASIKAWTAGGGEFINLPADQQADMIKTMSGVGADITKDKPPLAEAFKIVSDAAQKNKVSRRLRSSPRKRGPSLLLPPSRWIPAFAGMSGLIAKSLQLYVSHVIEPAAPRAPIAGIIVRRGRASVVLSFVFSILTCH